MRYQAEPGNEGKNAHAFGIAAKRRPRRKFFFANGLKIFGNRSAIKRRLSLYSRPVSIWILGDRCIMSRQRQIRLPRAETPRRATLTLVQAVVCGLALCGFVANADAQYYDQHGVLADSSAAPTYPQTSATPQPGAPVPGESGGSVFETIPSPSETPLSASPTAMQPGSDAALLRSATAAPSQQTAPTSLAPTQFESPFSFDESWSWQVLPDGIMYKSYLADNHDSRMGSQWIYKKDYGWLWDATLGARAGILRYGNQDPFYPEGWQLDIEGAAFVRMNLEHDRDVDSVDYRFGVPLTARRGAWEMKFGYYHLSSHMGDEYMVRNNSLDRINYVRENLLLGVGLHPNQNMRLYSEVIYGFYTDGGAEPWMFQFGAEYSPITCSRAGGAPFVAVHGRISQETDWSGGVTFQTGWQWHGRSNHTFRIGMQYFNGMEDQAQMYNHWEQQVGGGIWYDF